MTLQDAIAKLEARAEKENTVILPGLWFAIGVLKRLSPVETPQTTESPCKLTPVAWSKERGFYWSPDGAYYRRADVDAAASAPLAPAVEPPPKQCDCVGDGCCASMLSGWPGMVCKKAVETSPGDATELVRLIQGKADSSDIERERQRLKALPLAPTPPETCRACNGKGWVTPSIKMYPGDRVACSMCSSQSPGAVETPEGWQLMETAPKDGRYVLLVERPWRGDGDSFVTVGMWSSSVRALQEDAGWVRYGVGNIDAARLTHWMPLPAPPSGGSR